MVRILFPPAKSQLRTDFRGEYRFCDWSPSSLPWRRKCSPNWIWSGSQARSAAGISVSLFSASTSASALPAAFAVLAAVCGRGMNAASPTSAMRPGDWRINVARQETSDRGRRSTKQKSSKIQPCRLTAHSGRAAPRSLRIKSSLILQPGPAALTDGLAELQRIVKQWATRF